jgi:hypothetical protein
MFHLEAKNIKIAPHEVELHVSGAPDSDKIWRLGDISTQAVSFALEDGISNGTKTLLPEHILAGILRAAGQLLHYINPDSTLTPDVIYKHLKGEQSQQGKRQRALDHSIPFARETVDIFEHAVNEAWRSGSPYIYVEHLLLSLCRLVRLDGLMSEGGITADRIHSGLKRKKREELLRFVKAEKKADYDDYQLTGKVFIGTRAKYKLIRFERIGGMGAIYAALRYSKGVDNIPEKLTDAVDILPLHIYPTCIKYLKPEVIAKHKKGFIKEINIMQNLIHPNIVRTFDSGETKEGRLFYAMEC